MKKGKSIYLNHTFAIVLTVCMAGIVTAISPLHSGVGLKGIQADTFKLPVIVGEEDKTSLCLSPLYMFNAWYDLERLDTIADTLDLATEGKDTRDFYFSPLDGRPRSYLPKRFSDEGLRVIVDTANVLTMTKRPIWASGLFSYRFYKDDILLQDDTLVQKVQSFPIYVANLSTDAAATVEVQDGSMVMVVQALDSKGEWKQIEYWSHSWCGNSYFEYTIPPRHYIFTRGVKCSGAFTTQCRMMLVNDKDTLYSNVFTMPINKTQFERPVLKDR